MIHLIVRLPVPYQRTLCRTLHDYYFGAFTAWFGQRTNEEFPAEDDTNDKFRRQYLSEVGYGKLFRALREDREAVVILGGWSSPMTSRTLLFATLLRIPVFIWADHPHPRRRPRIKEAGRKLYLRCLATMVKGFLASGQPTADHLASLGIPRKKITNFPYWVAVPDHWSLPRRVEADGGATPLRLLAVGRQVPIKQFEVAVRAIFEVNADGRAIAELVVAGDGPERAKLKELAASLAVHFPGWLPNAEIYKELERADALVLTSQFDAYGVVVLEAMAMGRPVLASDGVIAARDRNEGGAIFLHPAGNAEVLAEQIRGLAADRHLLRQVATAARAVAEKWRPERAATILDGLLIKTKQGSTLLQNRVTERAIDPKRMGPVQGEPGLRVEV